jgi:hypothetical protein
MKLSAEEKAQQAASQSSSNNEKEFSLEEIEKHNKQDDAWLILVSYLEYRALLPRPLS